MCILAGAGTGKTRTLTYRVAYGAATGAIDPRHTLVVTFTRHAAAEMRERLAALGATGVTAATFHSAALAQLRHFHPQVSDDPPPVVLDSTFGLVARAAKPHLVGAERYVPTRDLVAEIEWAKVRRLTPETYAPRAALEERECPIDPRRFAAAFAGYERAKAAGGRIDFADMLGRLIELLSDHDALRAQVAARYAHFSVDEYQDTSPIQEDLLALWLDGRREICVVGDPEQTIFGFAGASADFLTGFRRRYPDATVVELRRNYRSSPAIIEVANRLNVPLAGDRVGRLISELPAGPAPRFVAAPDADAELDALTHEVARLRGEAVAAEEIAVLVRLNAALVPIEAALARAGIAYRLWGEAFFARPEVRRIADDLRSAARRAPEAPARGSLERILADRLGYDPAAPVVGDEAIGRVAAAETLLGIADGCDDVAGLVEEIERRAAEESAGRTDGVNLLTIHRAKGLEWGAVILPGWEEGTLPIRQSLGRPAGIAEERRLAYVAVTRARRHLFISTAARRPSGSGTEQSRKPSRFLAAAGFTADDGLRPRGGARPGTAARARTGARTPTHSSDDDPLVAALRAWRLERARADGVPAYVVAPNETLDAIADARPSGIASLRRVRGMGEKRLALYGDEILAVIARAPR